MVVQSNFADVIAAGQVGDVGWDGCERKLCSRRGCHTGSAEPQIVVLKSNGPCRRERLLDAGADCATNPTIREMASILWRPAIWVLFVAKFVIVDGIALVMLPGHASLEIDQRMALRAKRVTEATDAGDEDVRTRSAGCAHNRSGNGKTGVGAIRCGATGIHFNTKNPAVLLPIVADLASQQEYRGIDDIPVE